MNPLFLFLLLGGSAGSGKDAMTRILPATIPGPTGVALAAVFAKKAQQSQEQANKDREQADKEIIDEVIKIDEIADAAALKNKFRKLYDLFDKLPKAVQDSIFPAPLAAGKPARKP